MKKFLLVLVAVAAVFATSCSQKNDGTVITVGATPEPHAEMLNLIIDDMAEMGYTLKVQEFTDYVTPNEAVEAGEIEANFFQHIPYMESFNEERGYHLVKVVGTHVEPLALYSKKVSDYHDLAQESTIAIPNDPTNEGRALLLLESAGIIKLNPNAGLTAVPADVVENVKNIQFKEIEAASLPRVLDDVDAAVINGNYAIPAGLTATEDGLFIEGADSPYVNVITVKAGLENDPRVQALAKAITSDEVRDYLKKTYPNGEVVPAF